MSDQVIVRPRTVQDHVRPNDERDPHDLLVRRRFFEKRCSPDALPWSEVKMMTVLCRRPGVVQRTDNGTDGLVNRDAASPTVYGATSSTRRPSRR